MGHAGIGWIAELVFFSIKKSTRETTIFKVRHIESMRWFESNILNS